MSVVIFFVAAAGYTLGVGRTVPTIAAVLALVSVIVGAVILVRRSANRGAAALTVLLGVIGLAVGGLHAAYAADGLGTGNGLAGAIAALLLGLIGTALGAIALRRPLN